MKDYFYRITHECKKWELVYWWIVRATMIYAVIDSAIKGDIQQVLQSAANLVGMFAWEIFLIGSEKRWTRYIPSYLQDVLVAMLWLASYGGAYLNFYYKINSWDIVMHVVLGGFAVVGGYEMAVAMQKRDKTVSDVGVALLCGLGFSFMVGIGWELFEFTFDQVAGGDTQHWSKALAEEAAVMYNNPHLANPNFIDALDPMRYSLIDTMEDIICNTVGAVVAYIALRIYPYWHKGKRDVNKLFADKELQEAAK